MTDSLNVSWLRRLVGLCPLLDGFTDLFGLEGMLLVMSTSGKYVF